MNYHEKIAKLLAKAERTDNEHERDAYTQQAERLMLKLGIERAELESAGEVKAEDIVEVTREWTGNYAITMVPGDLGTKGGLRTDVHGRVLRTDGSVIDGLYAAGNVSAPVMGHTYAGPGATIGPALAFGYLVQRKAMLRRQHAQWLIPHVREQHVEIS